MNLPTLIWNWLEDGLVDDEEYDLNQFAGIGVRFRIGSAVIDVQHRRYDFEIYQMNVDQKHVRTLGASFGINF